MLTRDIDIATVSLSVRSSIRLSRSGIVSKQLNISSYFLHHMVALSFYSFSNTKHLCEILTGSPEYKWV